MLGKDDAFERRLRSAREPFVSYVEAVGFPEALGALVRSARKLVEENPAEFGVIEARGVRDEGTLWFAGQAGEDERQAIEYDYRRAPDRQVARIPARVFGMIAYRHPFFDGNKRTAFVSAALIGLSLGFEIRPTPYSKLEEEVRDLTAREASEGSVADWLLSNLFIPALQEGD